MSSKTPQYEKTKKKRDRQQYCAYHRIDACTTKVSTRALVCEKHNKNMIVDLNKCRFAKSIEFPFQSSNRRINIQGQNTFKMFKLRFVYMNCWHLVMFQNEYEAREATDYLNKMYPDEKYSAFQLHDIYSVVMSEGETTEYDYLESMYEVRIGVDRVSRKLKGKLIKKDDERKFFYPIMNPYYDFASIIDTMKISAEAKNVLSQYCFYLREYMNGNTDKSFLLQFENYVYREFNNEVLMYMDMVNLKSGLNRNHFN